MKKKNLFIIFVCIMFIFISLLLYYFAFSKTYGFVVENKKSGYINNPELYVVETNCQNAESRWDYSLNTVIFKNVTGTISCDVDYNTSSNHTTLAEQIISLAGQETFMDEVDYHGNNFPKEIIFEDNITYNFNPEITVSTGYRYQGVDPNNYVWFNNERWRIIGVLGDEYHNQTGKYLVKIIKDTPITEVNITSEIIQNGFIDSDVYNVLNNYYFYKNGDTYGRNACNANEMFEHSTRCDFSQSGITDWYSYNMIENVTWYTSSYNIYNGGDIIPDDSEYYLSRNIKSRTSNSSFNGYIGVPNVSDFVFSIYKPYYRNVNWLGNILIGYTYFMDQYIYITTKGVSFNNEDMFHSDPNDLFGYSQNPIQLFITPTLYLKEEVFARSGTGTYDDPFILELNK